MPDLVVDSSRLRIERGQCKAKITRFETYLNSVTADKILELETRLNDVIKLLDVFNEIQLQFEVMDPGELDTDERNNLKECDSDGKAENVRLSSAKYITVCFANIK